MKRYLDFMIVAALFVTSCAKEEQTENLVKAPSIFASQENNPNTKTLLAVNEGVGTIYWQPAEDINVFFGTTSVKYTSTNTENVTTAAFETSTIIGSSEGSSTNIWGLYPYSSEAVCNGSKVTTTIPSTQYGVPETFDKNLFTTLAHSTTKELQFLNVCGGIKFSLSRADITKITFEGNNGETLAGKVDLTFVDDVPAATSVTAETKITLTPKTGSTFAKDVNYYIITLPVSMTSGFTMTFETATQIGTFNYTTKAVTVSRSKFSKKENIDTYANFVDKPTSATDLSALGTANCYIVSTGGTYKFKTVQGNSVTSVGDVKGVKVLWETFGTSTAPSVGDLIKADVSYSDNYITFSTNDTYKEGNAVIAAYSDAGCTDGNVLWSWHIWLTDKPIDQIYNNNAGTMMDRNLGATSANIGDVCALGLLYQWGRKDPFLSGNDIYYYDDEGVPSAASTIIWPGEIYSTNTIGTIEYAIKNPTTFISYNNINYDWYYTGDATTDNSRWQTSTDNKSLYDPCPMGYRVPDGGPNGLWATAFETSSDWTNKSNWDGINRGMDFGVTDIPLSNSTVWYPASGFHHRMWNDLRSVGYTGTYWSCTPSDNALAYYMFLSKKGIVSPGTSASYRSYGQSVRCVKDVKYIPFGCIDLSKDGTANCYVVSVAGKYTFKAVQGNSTTSIGNVKGIKVLWESFGTDVVPSVGDLIKSDVSYNDGFIIFSTNDTYKKGNAVIAAYSDANCTDGNVLWSWHIWLTDQPEEQVYYNNAGTMMDRNLGATSSNPGDNAAIGLYYQWGRKDPFPGAANIQSTAKAKTSISWPSSVNSDSSTGTIEYSVKHPSTFLKYSFSGSGQNFDWLYSSSIYSDETRWQSVKTIYDPCPPGWRMPNGSVWSCALGSSSSSSCGTWDSVKYGMDFTQKLGSDSNIWYPAADCIDYSGSMYNSTRNGYYWSATSSSPSSARYFHISESNSYYPYMESVKALAYSVRCQKNQ